ncbi:MAG: ABC transporter ATP-binding protein [Chloroflexi bacterium]|nr:ABC transporter ATP-binding protein [Chloroflexota bacterium]
MDLETLSVDSRHRTSAVASGNGQDSANGDFVVETHNLTKRYGENIVAVDSLNLRLRRGEVYGFLGPNGAGKTTTLRMLLGLIRPTSGNATVLGEQPGSPSSLARLGALVETPAFYPYLSGRDNLLVLALHAGIPMDRIGTVLEQVNLAYRARDAFKTYSLGMKQRLGVAAALMKDPELLILDEPTNGLDPAGMAEMRALIRSLGRENRTVLLSSHLMTEVEQVCDRVGVIHGGKLVAEGRVDELRGQGSLRVRAHPLDDAQRVVSGVKGVVGVQVVEDTLRIAVAPTEAARINRELISSGIAVSELYSERASLETIFLELTNNGGDSNVE